MVEVVEHKITSCEHAIDVFEVTTKLSYRVLNV